MGRYTRETFWACKGLKSASKVLLTPIANHCIKWGMPIERAMQYAHMRYAKHFACVFGESLYKGLTETLIKRMQQMNGLFHTPESMDELMDWLKATNDSTAMIAAMMMQNLLTSKYDLTPKK